MGKKVERAPETVFERFVATARRQPSAVAYAGSGATLSFGELEARARALLAAVVARGAAEPGIVAILTADRASAIIAMLGVAGSGHAYVLLDPAEPDGRLRPILDEIEPLAVIADADLAKRAAALAGSGCAVIDPAAPGDSADPDPAPRASPDSLLYVSYTSGSTGVPKGVCQTHRNLLFFAQAYVDLLGLTEADRLSWLFAPGASASNMDVYGAFLSGARLCAYEIRTGSFPALADWLDRDSITVLHTVPTVVRELTRAIDEGRKFDSVRAIDLAGEMLFASDIARIRPHVAADCRIYNRLAATEASFVSSLSIADGVKLNEGALPVGTTPPDVAVAILRDDGSAAKTGETGTIAVDSPHVAPGYFRRDDLTKAAFGDAPGRPGWRRYTSADLGRIDADGNLHFLGRSGSRIKLRGQAIDLSEVEAALLACSGVTGAVALPHGPEGQEADELIAFLTLAPGVAEDALAIRKQLAELLPAPMLPTGYVFLESFPETATSKVDRKALEALDLARLRFRPGYVPPADDLEEKVAELFADVLEVAGVGRLDDFFLLGGDSLALTNLQILATEEFGRQLPDLHANATVAGIADRLRELGPGGGTKAPILLPLRPEGSALPLFVVHGRRGQAHVGASFLALLGDDQPLYALQARGLDGRQPPHRSISAMAEEYVAAIRAVRPHGPYFLGGFCAGSFVALEMARMLIAAGEDVLPPLLIDPPPPPFYRPEDDLSDEVLHRVITHRVKLGRWKVDLTNADAVRAAMDVARAIDDALRDYQVSRVPFETSVIATSERWRTSDRIKQVIGPRARAYMIGGDHVAAMLETPIFASHVRNCLANARTAAARLQETPAVS